jgi:hypothetical protein
MTEPEHAIEELRGHLEALAARVDEQAAEIVRLRAEAARGTGVPPPPLQAAPADVATNHPPAASRRRLLQGALAAAAAGTALAVEQDRPALAHDPDDIRRNDFTGTNQGAALYNLSSTILLPYAFWGDNYTSTELPLPVARIGLAGTVNGVDNTTRPHYGVYGAVDTGIGVVGIAPSPGTGMRGEGKTGMFGLGQGSGGIGVRGEASTGSGVDGRGREGVIGVGAETGFLGFSANGIGARCDSDNGTGFLGVSRNGRAGRFVGDVLVEGDLTVVGSINSASAAQAEGGSRRLYAVESPESWAEDFGEDRLVNGRATVRLDPEFNALVRGDKYHIFLTAQGDCKGLYVSRKGPNGFDVRELQDGTSSLAFDYRVVAKRRDIPGRRLERVDVPPRPAALPVRLREVPTALPGVPNQVPESPTVAPTAAPSPRDPRR